jgi:glycosyltransferase involved in cell wall biosynthesis
VHHVNFRLSTDAADIGRWRVTKTLATVRFALLAVRARFAHGCDTLYYVPAPPGKRGALYRDWVVMALCRPFFPRLVLHWHAAGLGEWLATRATALERGITRALLGRAEIALVLADALRGDAESLSARTVSVVPNGIADPCEVSPPPADGPRQVLFLGIGSEEKGLFATAEAVLQANRRTRRSGRPPAFVLVAAGAFDSFDTASRFANLCRQHPHVLQHVGQVDGETKRRLFAASHLLCFPTHYPAEGMPLVAIEALAHDRPVVATAWRALPDVVTAGVGVLVPPRDEAALVGALLALRANPPPAGACRSRFLGCFTLERHLHRLAGALRPA